MLVLALTLAAQAQDVRIERLARGFVNPWAIVAGDKVVLVDTHYARATRWLEHRIEKVGIDPHQISAIVLTHGHADHAGAAAALHAWTGAPVILGAGDLEAVRAGHNPPIVPLYFLARFVKLTIEPDYPPFTPDVVVHDVLDLRPYGIPGVAKVLGGHTPGSLVVQLDTGDVFVGDLLRGRFTAHHAPTEHFFQDDLPGAHDALRALLTPGVARIYPGHGDVMDPVHVQRWLGGAP